MKTGYLSRQKAASWASTLSTVFVGALVAIMPTQHRVHALPLPGPVYVDFKLYTSYLALGLAIGCWLLGHLLDPARKPWRMGPLFILAPMAGLIILSVIGIPFAVDPRYSAGRTAHLILMLAFYLYLLNARLSPAAIAWPLAAGMLLQAAVGIPQFLLGSSVGLPFLGEPVLDSMVAGTSVLAVGERVWLRAYGLSQHPNMLGGFMASSLLMALGFYLTQSRWRSAAMLGALAAGLAVLLLTFSRSAWLGLGIGGLALGAMYVRYSHQRGRSCRPLMLAIASALVLGIVFVATQWPLLLPRLGMTYAAVEVRSVDQRASLMRGAWALIRLRPLLGVGLGNCATALLVLAPESVADYAVYLPVHNVPLLTIAELGVAGGILWGALTLAPWAAMWLRRRHLRWSPWLMGLSAASAALIVTSLFGPMVWATHQGRLLQWMIWGLWASEWLRIREHGSAKEATG